MKKINARQGARAYAQEKVRKLAVRKEHKTSTSFYYSKGGVTLEFSLSHEKGRVDDFIKCLEAATEDLKKLTFI